MKEVAADVLKTYTHKMEQLDINGRDETKAAISMLFCSHFQCVFFIFKNRKSVYFSIYSSNYYFVGETCM